ncbi:guanine nucleotide exchange factor [Anaeramoeba ignava]|uniref:Guanine nucleotide exchange factor n=1 Tax=Anaeramoeba ignava TaxID=1746090 RepID=A0A9Q0R8L7_ANAIG|nr:guanine nucleotide exchange factor [Anaeramoeba ignava]
MIFSGGPVQFAEVYDWLQQETDRITGRASITITHTKTRSMLKINMTSKITKRKLLLILRSKESRAQRVSKHNQISRSNSKTNLSPILSVFPNPSGIEMSHGFSDNQSRNFQKPNDKETKWTLLDSFSDGVESEYEHDLTPYENDDREEESDDEEVHIGDEPPDNKNNITFCDSTSFETHNIRSANLNKIIERITQVQVDIRFVYQILLTYRCFTTPSKFLQKLIERYHIQQFPGEDTTEFLHKKQIIQLRICNILKNWLETILNDPDCEKILSKVSSFINVIEADKPQIGRLIRDTCSNFPKRGVNRVPFHNQILADPIVPKNIFHNNLSFFDIDEEEIARQMTLIDQKLYHRVKPSEFMNHAWVCEKAQEFSPHILEILSDFEKRKNFVISTILQNAKTKQRGYLVFIPGLQSTMVQRLRLSWDELNRRQKAEYHDIQHLASDQIEFKQLKHALSLANPPCIPYLGMALADLTNIFQNQPAKLGGLINVSRLNLIYETVLNYTRFWSVRYDFIKVSQIHKLLSNLLNTKFDEDEMQQISLSLESESPVRSNIL